MEANLLHIKAAACGGLTKSPMPSGCGCMFDCDMLLLGGLGGALAYITSLCDISDVSLTHNIPSEYLYGATLEMKLWGTAM